MLSKTISTNRSASFLVSSAASATSSTSSAFVMQHLSLRKIALTQEIGGEAMVHLTNQSCEVCSIRTLSENNRARQDAACFCGPGKNYNDSLKACEFPAERLVHETIRTPQQPLLQFQVPPPLELY